MQYIDRSPAILTSDDFIRSNEIIRINGQIIKSLAILLLQSNDIIRI